MATANARKVWPANSQRLETDSDWFQKQVIDKYGLKLSGRLGGVDTFLGKSRGDARGGEVWVDHPKLWTRDGKIVLLTSEPYGLSFSELSGLVSFCRIHGLTADIDAASPHFRGRTLLVMVWKNGAREQ